MKTIVHRGNLWASSGCEISAVAPAARGRGWLCIFGRGGRRSVLSARALAAVASLQQTSPSPWVWEEPEAPLLGLSHHFWGVRAVPTSCSALHPVSGLAGFPDYPGMSSNSFPAVSWGPGSAYPHRSQEASPRSRWGYGGLGWAAWGKSLLLRLQQHLRPVVSHPRLGWGSLKAEGFIGDACLQESVVLPFSAWQRAVRWDGSCLLWPRRGQVSEPVVFSDPLGLRLTHLLLGTWNQLCLKPSARWEHPWTELCCCPDEQPLPRLWTGPHPAWAERRQALTLQVRLEDCPSSCVHKGEARLAVPGTRKTRSREERLWTHC